ADISLPPSACRTEKVEAYPAGDRREPGTRRLDGFLLLRGHGVPADVGLLDGILSLGQGAQEPVRQIDQSAALAHDRGQTWVGLAVSSPDWRVHGGLRLPSSHLRSPVRRDGRANCDIDAPQELLSRRAVLSFR